MATLATRLIEGMLIIKLFFIIKQQRQAARFIELLQAISAAITNLFIEVQLLVNFQNLIDVQYVKAFKLWQFMVTPILLMEQVTSLINSEPLCLHLNLLGY